MVGRAVCAGAVLLLIAEASLALPLDRTITQLQHTTWTAKDGAPSQVSALAQTADGYLWIGTARGLFRFDGVQFERFAPRNVELPAHNIYTLLATADGGLWISFRPSGLGFLKDGRLTVWSRPEELPSSQVYALARDGEGRIWAGTHDGLVLRSGSRWIPVASEWKFRPERIRHLLVDRAGTLWVGTDTTVVFLRPGTTAFQPTGARVRELTWSGRRAGRSRPSAKGTA